jgi:hypothetical protein
VKNRKFSSAGESSSPAKTWSLDDIDRLIAETNGEEYIPPKKEEKTTPAQDFAKILGREFDTGIFTIRPMGEENKVKEMQDISSSSGESEVDGQETFYDKENEFDESVFEIETVIVPEDKDPTEEKINKYLVEKGYRDDSPDLTESKIKLFDDYREAILDYNEKVNITRIVEKDDFERRHYIDSLMCCTAPEFRKAGSIIDIGSGGGFL